MSISLTLGIVSACLLPAGSESETAKTPGVRPVLTTVGAIRQLSAEEARRGFPVRIRGVLTLNNPYTALMFVQDETGGIYVSPDKLPWPERTGFSQGMLVEIEGRTSFGRFSPTVRGKEDAAVIVKVLGRAPLPEPLQPSIVQLADPRYQNQWIEISGVVRQVTGGSLFEGAIESVVVTVASPAGRVTVAAFRPGQPRLCPRNFRHGPCPRRVHGDSQQQQPVSRHVAGHRLARRPARRRAVAGRGVCPAGQADLVLDAFRCPAFRVRTGPYPRHRNPGSCRPRQSRKGVRTFCSGFPVLVALGRGR